MAAPQLTPTSISNDDTLLLAILIAAGVHICVLLGINFKAPQPAKIARAMEITLAHAPLKNAPKEARFLAAEHQLGGGDRRLQPEPVRQYIPPQPQQAPQSAVSEVAAPREIAHEVKKPTVQKLLSKPQAEVKIDNSKELIDDHPAAATEQQKPRLSAEALQQQIAQLGEQIRDSQKSAEDNKIKFVNSVSTHKVLAAQYEMDWKNKVESTGNRNYPEAARNATGAQSLTMDVGINADGSIYSIRISRSSGNPTLDEAAKRIVRMSAPFAELPPELLKELNVLVITRVWKFSDETGMMTAH